MAATRKAIHAYLSPQAHDAWHEFAADHGVSVSGLLEAMASTMSTHLARGEPALADEERLVRLARRIDADRRRRKRS